HLEGRGDRRARTRQRRRCLALPGRRRHRRIRLRPARRPRPRPEGGRRRHCGPAADRGHRHGAEGAAAAEGAAQRAELTGLDLTPLERGAGLRDRLRSLGSSPLLLAATTIGVLLVVAPLLGMLAAVLVAGPTDRGLLFFLSLFVVCGIWVILDGLRKAGTGARLETFARANDLELTRSLAARQYAGSRFRSGERIVLHSLRTRTAPVLEVGDTWLLQRGRVRVSSRGAVSAANPPAAEGFLRVVVHDPHGQRPEEFPMTAQLDAAIGGLLGPYRLEVGDGEVTVMGSEIGRASCRGGG